MLSILFLGSFGVHTTIPAKDKESREFFGKLGFVDYTDNTGTDDNTSVVIMSRSF